MADLLNYLKTRGFEPVDLGGDFAIMCPFHADKNPSLKFKKEALTWYCHACKEGGGMVDFEARLLGVGRSEAFVSLQELGFDLGSANTQQQPQKSRERTAQFTEKVSEYAQHMHDRLLKSPDRLAWLSEARGLNMETVCQARLGWTGEKYTIPVTDETGKVVNVRLYSPGSTSSKYSSLSIEGEHHGELRLYGIEQLPGPDEVVLCEGELDSLVARQAGFVSVTGTTGAGAFDDEWIDLFRGAEVFVAMDNDDAGQTAAIRILQKLDAAGIKCRHVVLPPEVGLKGDITDLFVKLGFTGEKFRALLDEAEPFGETPLDNKLYKTTLSKATSPELYGKRVQLEVVVNGAAGSPYFMPQEIRIECPHDENSGCRYCGVNKLGADPTIRLTEDNPQCLALIRCTENQRRAAIKQLAKIPQKCVKAEFIEITQTIVQPLRVVPALNYSADTGADHVAAQVYSIGEKVRANQQYIIRGRVWQNPMTQQATILFADSAPAQTDVGSFKITPELTAELRSVFTPEKGQEVARLDEIYQDLEANVVKIVGRATMLKAMDLIWHSVLSFNFLGSPVLNGWTQGLIVGDTGQAKTTAAMRLIEHYRLGELISGEQASFAGLIGGMQNTDSGWFVTWGRLPLNDGRMVIIDEFSGLKEEDVSALSSVRSNGIAVLTKIEQDKTLARVRFLAMSNPRDGRKLDSHVYGCESIYKIIPANEDIRRFDFAMAVASGEVPIEVMNRRKHEKVEHQFTSDLCNKLLLWAWSRKPAQIKFTRAAEDAILAKAIEFANLYSPAMPLVEPSDQRHKIARLSVAMAARLFSASDDGQSIVVHPVHVQLVSEFLHSIYSAPSFGYDEFSAWKKRDSLEDEGAKDKILEWIEGQFDYLRLVDVILRSGSLTRQSLMDEMALDQKEATKIMSFLSANGQLRRTKVGYFAQPGLISLLREIRRAHPNGEEDEEQPKSEEKSTEEAQASMDFEEAEEVDPLSL